MTKSCVVSEGSRGKGLGVYVLRSYLFLFFDNVFKGLCALQVSAVRCSFVRKSKLKLYIIFYKRDISSRSAIFLKKGVCMYLTRNPQ